MIQLQTDTVLHFVTSTLLLNGMLEVSSRGKAAFNMLRDNVDPMK